MSNDKATILVVDDVPDNIMILSDLLTRDYEVVAAINGERALKIMESDTPPDMVLLDVMMPGIDGFEVCRRIRSNPATSFIPVVMITALSGADDRIEAITAGADDFLTKPFEPNEVQARVRSLLRVKRQHDALQKSYSDLQKLEELRLNLTHMIIHDLRTPLNAIIGGLSLLYLDADIEGNAAAEEMYQMASLNSHKLLDMINVLLDITKMESGEMQIDCTPVDVSEMVSEVEGSMRGLAKFHSLSLTTEVAPSLPLLKADREMLRRVLVNLAGNALKFTQPDGFVHLEAENAASGFVKLSVTDNGPGIPPGYEDRIFEKFGQVEGSQRKALSTGLGLTFCKMAVEAHGGKIWVESGTGQGSIFSVLWPTA